MKTICITAAASKLGKTTLVQELIPVLKNWAVCKVTTCVRHTEESCPRGHEETCGICNSLNLPYVIIADKRILDKPGTDTGKYAAAGAAQVLWIQTRPEALSDSLQEAVSRLSDVPGVIFEGNHVMQHLKPDFSIMMTKREGHFKQSALAIRDSIDLFVEDWNFGKAVDEVRKKFL